MLWSWHSAKLGSGLLLFPALPSAVTIALGKLTKNSVFFIFYIPSRQTQIITYISHPSKHTSHIYHIHRIYHIHHIYHIHQSKHLSHISQLSKYTTSAWQVYQKSITKWTTNANTTNATHQKGGNWVPGEGKAGSVGGAWAGLFEPFDWGCTKEKRLHALDKITWIANLGHTSKAQAKTHRSSCSCRSRRWSEKPRWHS